MKPQIIGLNGRLTVKPEFFNARDHHLKGNDKENIIEVAGRICYDSFDQEKTRNSIDYHKHIVEVRHTSVLGHSMIHFMIEENASKEWCYNLAHEPGWYLSLTEFKIGNRRYNMMNANIRFLERMNNKTACYLPTLAAAIQKATHEYPLIMNSHTSWNSFPNTNTPNILFDPELISLGLHGKLQFQADKEMTSFPLSQYWVSLILSGSRSWSHEHVRHSYESAISQRSTRYVEEDINNSFIPHPYYEQAIHPLAGCELPDTLRTEAENLINASHKSYTFCFNQVQQMLIANGVDKFTAKKQARGAAARFLLNGLKTEMVFSATLREWKTIFHQRINPTADKEIDIITDGIKTEIENNETIPEFLKDHLFNKKSL